MENNKKKIYGTLILALLFFVTPVFASYCADTTTLTSTLVINGQSNNVNKTCSYGCDPTFNICSPSEFEVFLLILGSFVLLLLIILVMRKIKEKNASVGFITTVFFIGGSYYIFGHFPSFITNSTIGAFAYIGLFIIDIIAIYVLK